MSFKLTLTDDNEPNDGICPLNYIDLSQFRDINVKIQPNGDEFREEGGETVTITVEPGETGFFGLSAIDAFEKFSYTCQFDYLFTVAKVTAKFQQYSKEEDGEEGNEE